MSPRPADFPDRKLRPRLRLSLSALLACAALPLAACEHGIGLQGKVSVPGPLQRTFSAEHPGELVVRAQIPGQPDIAVPSVILCGASGDEQVIDVKYVKAACASDDTALVSAWVIPRAAHEVSCTMPPPMPRPADTEQSAYAIAFARTVAPVRLATEASTSCKDGSISFALTLVPR
jgi:hypothetical protein